MIQVHRDRKDRAEVRREIFELFLRETLCYSVAGSVSTNNDSSIHAIGGIVAAVDAGRLIFGAEGKESMTQKAMPWVIKLLVADEVYTDRQEVLDFFTTRRTVPSRGAAWLQWVCQNKWVTGKKIGVDVLIKILMIIPPAPGQSRTGWEQASVTKSQNRPAIAQPTPKSHRADG